MHDAFLNDADLRDLALKLSPADRVRLAKIYAQWSLMLLASAGPDAQQPSDPQLRRCLECLSQTDRN
jgi:hypothetical protein